MDTVFKLLVVWIVVLFIVNKLLARRKPKSIKMLVQRDGNYVEADAKLIERSKNASVDSDEFSLERGYLETVPYTSENLESCYSVLINQDDDQTKL